MAPPSAPARKVASYDLEGKDKDGFLADTAGGKAFRAFVRNWRARPRDMGKDRFEADLDARVSRNKLDEFLAEGDADGAAVVQGVIADFARNFAHAATKFTSHKAWSEVARMVAGGGLSERPRRTQVPDRAVPGRTTQAFAPAAEDDPGAGMVPRRLSR